MSSNAAEEESNTGDQQNGPTWRACDNCRLRKIRCDKGSPCSNCRASQTTCRTARKPKDQRQRILISNQYEKKIELIDDRLSRIERTLRSIAISSSAIPPSHTGNRTPGSVPQQERGLPILSIAEQDSGPSPEDVQFEGESSFSAQSMYASRLVEKAMSNSALDNPGTEMASALSSLRGIVEMQNSPHSSQDLRFPAAQNDSLNLDISKMELPPLAAVLTLLRECKAKRPNSFIDLGFLDTEEFNELCKKVFFCTEDYPLAVFAIVNGGLYYLFLEFSLLDGCDPEYEGYYILCRSNFERALGSFHLLMAPTKENVEALVLGALYAIDISKPSICWALTSSAARLCQALGYHRAASEKGQSKREIDTKRSIFWFVYMLDKSLSLRLGRASTLQDYDIDISLPVQSADPRLNAWELINVYWIKLSELHGLAYEQLYSPGALRESEGERGRKAKALIARLEQARHKIPDASTKIAYQPEYVPIILGSCDTIFYSLLTIIARAIPSDMADEPSGSNMQCVQAARAALKAHQKCARDFKDGNSYLWHGYLCWSLLQCPFAPYMVVFCHAIRTSDLDDLQCLGDVVATLQSSGEISEGVERLYRLCHVFYQVAKLYIESKLKQDQALHYQAAVGEGRVSDDVPMHAGGEFDPYLNALGFGPQGGSMNVPSQRDTTMEEYDPGVGMASAELGNWFAGNLNMMGLLEADLTDLDNWL